MRDSVLFMSSTLVSIDPTPTKLIMEPVLIFLSLFALLRVDAVDQRQPLYLLNLIPFRDDRPDAGWDEGLELIPAANLAIQHINRSEILKGYELNVINTNSEACQLNNGNDGIVNFVRYSIHSDKNIVGVVGLFCSTSAEKLSPVAGRDGVDLIQIASSNSPEFVLSLEIDPPKYPHLYRTISSTLALSEVVVEMMKSFNWERISVIGEDFSGIPFSSTARAFEMAVNAANDSMELEILLHREISQSYVSPVLIELQKSGGKLVVVSATLETVKRILCDNEVSSTGSGLVYVVLLYSLEEVANACGSKSLEVLESTFFVYFQLFREDNVEIISGENASQFNSSYFKELQRAHKEDQNVNLNGSIYAAHMYDQIWAFALALNRSSSYLNLTDYRYGDANATRIIENELKTLSFEGASGLIQFGPTKEAQTNVYVTLLNSDVESQTALYSPITKQFSSSFNKSDIPLDSFQEFHQPLWLVVASYFVATFCFVLVTAVLILHVYFRDSKEIKATSLFLCNLIFLGCYFLCFGLVITITQEGFVLPPLVVTILCNLELWFNFLGIDVIFTTLFVRLLRIYYIFSKFKKLGRLWDDKSLSLIVILVCVGHSVLLIAWTAADTFRYQEEHFITSAGFLSSKQVCHSEFLLLWTILLYVYVSILFVLVIFLAVKTRRIKRQEFKDTKKINAFVFFFFIVLIPSLALWQIFLAQKMYVLAYIFYVIGYASIILLCEFCLFIPKLVPLFIHKKKYRIHRGSIGEVLVKTISSITEKYSTENTEN